VRVDRLLGECGIPQDSDAGHRVFEQRLELRRTLDRDGDLQALRTGWCLGNEAFRQELLAQVNTQASNSHYGPELHDAAEQKANRIVAEALAKLGWTESELRERRKGAPEKILIAERLRRETTVTLAWVADRLFMGTKGHLVHLLYWRRRGMGKSPNRRSNKPNVTKKAALLKMSVQSNRLAGDTAILRTDPNEIAFDPSFD
jgi:hypothetical protein